MAAIKSNNKVTMSLNLALVLCLFLIISFAEVGFAKPPRCHKVYGVEAGDTCDGVVQKFGLTADFFAINPNINCNKIFVGQWLCIAGKA